MQRNFNASHLRDATRKGRAAAAARGAERDIRLRSVLQQLASYILSLRPSDGELEEIATKNPKWSSIPIWWCKPPSKDRETGEPRFPPDQTHFSGWENPGAGKDPRDGLKDPTKDGYPMIGLAQGFPKSRGDRKGDPGTLPEGKVLAVYLNEMLLDEAGGNMDEALAARAMWNPKERHLEVHLIWNIPDFEKWQRKIGKKHEEWKASRAAKHEAERAAEAAEAKTMTLEEHQRRQRKAAAPAPAPVREPMPEVKRSEEPESEMYGGFELVSKRRGRKQRA